MEQKAPEFILYRKVILFGSKGVGKTSLISRLETNTFSTNPSEDDQGNTSHFHYIYHFIDIKPNRFIYKSTQNNISLPLDLISVTLPEEFELDSKTKCLYREFLYECQCALYMFDITQKESFDDVKKILSFSSTVSPYLTLILIPNKQDLETSSAVSALEINQYASSINDLLIHKVSCSANTGISELAIDINKAFNKGHKLAVNIVTECTSKQKSVVSAFQPSGFLRIVLLGDSSVGKTAFMNRFFTNTFNETFLSTIGIDDATTFVKIQGNIYKVTVWDTAGQERFRSLPKKYYQNADGIFLLFDVCKEDSFNNIKSWMKDIRDNTMKQVNVEGGDGLIIYLIGNKIDIVDERVITREMAERQANELNMKYYEVSCKANINIIDVMSKMIVECFSKTTGIKDAFALDNSNKGEKGKKKGCC